MKVRPLENVEGLKLPKQRFKPGALALIARDCVIRLLQARDGRFVFSPRRVEAKRGVVVTVLSSHVADVEGIVRFEDPNRPSHYIYRTVGGKFAEVLSILTPEGPCFIRASQVQRLPKEKKRTQVKP